MRILFNNLITLAAITANDESLNYPATPNIADTFLKRRFQSSSSTSTITILFSSDQDVNCIFYGLHNLTALTIRLKDLGGATLLTIPVSTIRDRGGEYFALTSGVRSVELDLTGPDPVYLGGIGLGVYYQSPDFLASFSEDGSQGPVFDKSRDGQVSVDKLKPLRVYPFAFRDRTVEDKDEFLDLIDSHFPGPLWFDLSECDQDFLGIIYATILQYPGMAKNGRRYDNSLQLEEAR
jgi:hypothetical protein